MWLPSGWRSLSLGESRELHGGSYHLIGGVCLREKGKIRNWRYHLVRGVKPQVSQTRYTGGDYYLVGGSCSRGSQGKFTGVGLPSGRWSVLPEE